MLAKLFAVVTYIVGLAGAGLFYAYVVGAGIGYWPRNLDNAVHASFGWNYGLLMLFAIQHSGMQRRSFWLLPEHLERSAYVAASGIILGLLTIYWQPLPGNLIWDGPIWLIGISILGFIGIGLCGSSFEHATFFGLRQAWTGQPETSGSLIVSGPYRFVRHPLMLCLLIAIWGQPTMPPELLMLNGGMTLYVWFGTQCEEMKLKRDYGAAYEAYRNKVPALVPWKWW